MQRIVVSSGVLCGYYITLLMNIKCRKVESQQIGVELNGFKCNLNADLNAIYCRFSIYNLKHFDLMLFYSLNHSFTALLCGSSLLKPNKLYAEY